MKSSARVVIRPPSERFSSGGLTEGLTGAVRQPVRQLGRSVAGHVETACDDQPAPLREISRFTLVKLCAPDSVPFCPNPSRA